MEPKKTCFVVQGFGKKTDFRTGRVLDLDASYEVIKEAVEAAGLECVRADEIAHSGLIDKPMYEQILKADLVIADLSTSNVNAVYELGVRHAVRPRPTIIVAETEFDFAFDINRNLIRTYTHMGEDIGRKEARRFVEDLSNAIKEIIAAEDTVDSPLYTFIPGLQPPTEQGEPVEEAQAQPVEAATVAVEQPVRMLVQQAKQAMAEGNFAVARSLFQGVHAMRPHDDYVVQQMALATYKSKHPTPEAALREAKDMLNTLKPKASHDTETLGLWGAVHKRLWNITADPTDLDEAIFAHEKGFYLRQDYYNGINLAFLLNVRATLEGREPADAITDFVLAQRIRRQVVEICEGLLEILVQTEQEAPPETPEEARQIQEEKYWLLATLWEAAVGLGDEHAAATWKQQATEIATVNWMLESTQSQVDELEALLANSPLKHLAPA